MVKLLHSKLERFAKLKKLISAPVSNTHGYVYVSHMPTGLEEDGLRRFFSQFGKVLKVKLARSKKTGRSKCYSFIEFEEKEPAKIAAETMHGFLMFGKQLVCRFLEEVHKYAMIQTKKNVKDPYLDFVPKYNSQQPPEEVKKRVERLLEHEKLLRKKLKDSGIVYQFPGYVSFI